VIALSPGNVFFFSSDPNLKGFPFQRKRVAPFRLRIGEGFPSQKVKQSAPRALAKLQDEKARRLSKCWPLGLILS
jgi:hypothetical protein